MPRRHRTYTPAQHRVFEKGRQKRLKAARLEKRRDKYWEQRAELFREEYRKLCKRFNCHISTGSDGIGAGICGNSPNHQLLGETFNQYFDRLRINTYTRHFGEL